MRKRRETEVFGLSFMDSICCGFGAILLLYILLLGKPAEDITEQIDNLSAERAKITKMELERSRLQAILAELQQPASGSSISALEKKKTDLLQELAAQEEELQKQNKSLEEAKQAEKVRELFTKSQKTSLGLREDLTHVAFVIDTSGSMRDPNTRRIWNSILQKIEEVLATYPSIEAIQFLDTSGNYILKQRQANWLPDQTVIRSKAQQAIFQYSVYSVSNPYPGIERAIKDLSRKTTHDSDRMGIILFGDEFNRVAPATLTKLDKLNPWRIADKERIVSINAFGFPTVLSFSKRQSTTAFQFATLMRQVTAEHNGTLILLRE